MINVEVLLPGLLILLQKYSDGPKQFQFNAFLSSLLAITRHNADAPTWLQLVGQTGVPAFANRTQLLNWFYGLAGIDRWPGAAILSKKPKLWGRYVWSLIHGLALLVRNESDRRFYYQWIKSLSVILPCSTCAESFARVIAKIRSHQIEANVYAMRLHEAVNQKMGKTCILYYPSGAETWRSALDNQHLLNYTALADIPLPVDEQAHHEPTAPVLRPRSNPPVLSRARTFDHHEDPHRRRPMPKKHAAPPACPITTPPPVSACPTPPIPPVLPVAPVAPVPPPLHRPPRRVEHRHLNCNCPR